MGVTILDLPVELIEEILSYPEYHLRKGRVRNLRYACSTLYHKTHGWFGRTFLNIVRCRFTPKTLDLLASLSENPHTRDYVKCLLAPETSMSKKSGTAYDWNRNEQRDIIQPYPKGFAKLESLLRDSFTKCSSLELVASIDDPSDMPGVDGINSIESFMLMLRIFANIKRPLDSINVSLNGSLEQYNKLDAILDYSFVDTAEFKAVWERLPKLCVITENGLRMPGWTMALIQRATSLQSLSIAGTTQMEQHFASAMLPPLSKLDLSKMHFTDIIFENLIQQLGPTLRDLSLDNVKVRDGCDWVPFIQKIRPSFTRLRRLRLNSLLYPGGMAQFPSVYDQYVAANIPWTNLVYNENFYMVCEVEKGFYIHLGRVYTGTKPGKDNWAMGFDYRGPEMVCFLRDVEQTVKVVWEASDENI